VGKFCILTPTSPPQLSGTLAHRPCLHSVCPSPVWYRFNAPSPMRVPALAPPASYELLQRSRPPPPTSHLRTSPPIVALADLPQLELAAVGAQPEGLLRVCHGVRPRCAARPRFTTTQPHHPHPGEICLSVLQFRVSSYLFNSASLFIRASVHLWNYLAT
jgi:hypothetical protein